MMCYLLTTGTYYKTSRIRTPKQTTLERKCATRPKQQPNNSVVAQTTIFRPAAMAKAPPAVPHATAVHLPHTLNITSTYVPELTDL